MAFFLRGGINPGIPGFGPLRVNIEDMEFSFSRGWTFLRGNDDINIFGAFL